MLPGGTSGKESPANAGYARDRVQSLGGKDLLEKEMATLSSILAWRTPPGKRRLVATVHGVTESDITELTYKLPDTSVNLLLILPQ